MFAAGGERGMPLCFQVLTALRGKQVGILHGPATVSDSLSPAEEIAGVIVFSVASRDFFADNHRHASGR